jgi:hypothetical protein
VKPIRSEIQTLIDRGHVVLDEIAELSLNSWEFEAIVPSLDREALFAEAIDRLRQELVQNETYFTSSATMGPATAVADNWQNIKEDLTFRVSREPLDVEILEELDHAFMVGYDSVPYEILDAECHVIANSKDSRVANLIARLLTAFFTAAWDERHANEE